MDDNEKQVTVREAAPQAEKAKGSKGKHLAAGIVVSLAVVGALTSGILPRLTARTTLRKDTAQMALPTVAVVRPERTAEAEEVVLPANVQEYISAPIYARKIGFLK